MSFDNPFLIGIITTVFGVIIGPLLKDWIEESEFFQKSFLHKTFYSLKGKWDSSWIDISDPSKQEFHETLIIDKQKSSDLSGSIEMSSEPDKKWNFKGNFFRERFLQLYYYPSKDAENPDFIDYGCYFLELKGDGSFNGQSIGFAYEKDKMEISNHKLKRLSHKV